SRTGGRGRPHVRAAAPAVRMRGDPSPLSSPKRFSLTLISTPAFGLDDLRDAFGGALHAPGDATYDAARAAWNLMADQRPALVALPRIRLHRRRRHRLGGSRHRGARAAEGARARDRRVRDGRAARAEPHPHG